MREMRFSMALTTASSPRARKVPLEVRTVESTLLPVLLSTTWEAGQGTQGGGKGGLGAGQGHNTAGGQAAPSVGVTVQSPGAGHPSCVHARHQQGTGAKQLAVLPVPECCALSDARLPQRWRVPPPGARRTVDFVSRFLASAFKCSHSSSDKKL